jgi:predicted phosphodiesterase
MTRINHQPLAWARENLLPLITSGEINKSEAARRLAAQFGIDKEEARSKVRYMTGARGGLERHNADVDLRSTIEDGLAKIRKEEKRKLQKVQLLNCKALILSDIHFPHQNTEALTLALNAGVEAGCDTVILNGDIVDFYRISRWAINPNGMRIEEEILCLIQFFQLLRKLFPTAPIYYVLGNHEVRFERYIIQNAGELLNLPELSFTKLIKADEYGVTVLSNDPIKLGKLNVMHGHEFGESFFSPVNPARGLFLRAKASTIVGHYHQPSEHTESNINGDQTACYSTGCLCELNPDYRPFAYTKWMHGFAIVEVDAQGGFTVSNKKIVNGSIR